MSGSMLSILGLPGQGPREMEAGLKEFESWNLEVSSKEPESN
jgi:hypothetical protein